MNSISQQLEERLAEDFKKRCFGNTIFTKEELDRIAEIWLSELVNIEEGVIPFFDTKEKDWRFDEIEKIFEPLIRGRAH